MDQILFQYNAEDVEYCKQVLRSVTISYRPLHLQELAATADLPKELFDSIPSLSQLVDRCGSFLTVREATVYFIHQSAKDYFITGNGRKIFPSSIVEDHGKITCWALGLMSSTLEKDICKLKKPGALSSEAEKFVLDKRLARIGYACSYWVNHLADHLADSGSTQQDGTLLSDSGKVHTFLKVHLLHWLEALSLLRKMPEGVLMIKQLYSMINPSKSIGLFALVHDAIRFVLIYRSIIEEAPLQIYCSALTFALEKSIIREQFKKQIPNWICGLPKVQNNWSSLLQTIEGHSGSVNAVAFSPDGKQVASASDDCTLKLWDSATGAALQTLKGHSGSVNAVAFLPDGKKVASASDDRTLRLWDSATGAALRLKGHSGRVKAVAFSPDGTQVASASDDCTLRLWDSATGAALQTLKRHPRSDPSVVFSLDGSKPYSFYSVDRSSCWVTQNGSRILYLPWDCRPGCFATKGSTIVIGSAIGQVTTITFCLSLETQA